MSGKPRYVTVCHPEREHVGKGLCKSCYRAQQYIRHRDQILQENRESRWLRKFGISADEYDKLFREQLGLCKICEQPNANGRRLAVDHNHLTGEIRGLLCTRCNLAIGLLWDNPRLASRLFFYLNKKEGQ